MKIPCSMKLSSHCIGEVDPNEYGVYREITHAWEKNRAQGGTNAVANAKRSDHYACRFCVAAEADGIAAGQTSLGV